MEKITKFLFQSACLLVIGYVLFAAVIWEMFSVPIHALRRRFKRR